MRYDRFGERCVSAQLLSACEVQCVCMRNSLSSSRALLLQRSIMQRECWFVNAAHMWKPGKCRADNATATGASDCYDCRKGLAEPAIMTSDDWIKVCVRQWSEKKFPLCQYPSLISWLNPVSDKTRINENICANANVFREKSVNYESENDLISIIVDYPAVGQLPLANWSSAAFWILRFS